jgi:hypothetical protein
MNKLWIWMLVAATLGFSTAWAINYQRFGHRVVWFGPFGSNSDLTPAGLGKHMEVQVPVGRPMAELIDSPNYDFGMMAPDTKGEHKFAIKNVGTNDLQLRLGGSTCKCTIGDLEREMLAPGEQTEITLSWHVNADAEDFSQSAEIITNDPANVVIRLGITGKIIQDIDIVPETWTFGEVATGEPFEIKGTIYSFLKTDIASTELKFSSEEMTGLSEFEVEPFMPNAENDGIRSAARQGFRVTARVKPGMRQGAVSQNLMFGFNRLDEQGQEIRPEGDVDPQKEYVIAPVKGSIVGSLSMILSSRLKGVAGGGYVYDFGRIEKDGSLVAKALVVLKGSERDSTNLRIGETDPPGVVKATLGEPKGQGSMKLFPLEIELVPGDEPIERMGRNASDIGAVWIESDNPKVAKMRIGLKFAIGAKSD